MQSILIANWKMHGDSAFLSEWTGRFSPPPECKVVVCPPLPYLTQARQLLPSQVSTGAQSVFEVAENGAHTGEVSARMLADVGCEYVIVGHSERRAAGESEKECAMQVAAAAAAGLIPVLCVGETAAQRDQGGTEEAVFAQLCALDSLPPGASCVVAYEPVWAIGSGKTPLAETLSQLQKSVRNRLISQKGQFGGKIPLLYGGSIRADNADLPKLAGMNGSLVGGASLDAAEFETICRAGGV